MTKQPFNSIYGDQARQSTGLLFNQVYNQWHSRIKQKLATIDLTLPQFFVLAATAFLQRQQDFVTQVDIARFSDMDVMTVSQVLRLLVKKNLLTREVHPKDSRAKIILLTEAGLAKVNQALPLVEHFDLEFFGKLEQEKEHFNQLLIKLEEKNA
ncbi:MarR family winged helix-turn-helix transcriptional regulator [Streptococcus panodentis]|uniref:MarR family transcriptional regulator n=1 Tax=Streptococcus panodentis TaxID=1581472 RepID=A0ABS5AZJ8_9STRE|nr:MarR family transcriptional regulator [Streptococcus panodentis]MBP2621999.1 MarR family transcriptional regulator [Streptococcus panodentis]